MWLNVSLDGCENGVNRSGVCGGGSGIWLGELEGRFLCVIVSHNCVKHLKTARFENCEMSEYFLKNERSRDFLG